MKEQKVIIKGMVCQRCISLLQEQLEANQININNILLGEIELSGKERIDPARLTEIIRPLGFQIVEDKRQVLVKEIKKLVAEIYSGNFDFPYQFRMSRYLSDRFSIEYNKLSATFAAIENITLEKYVIKYRVEKVKELLVYTDLSLAEISFRLGFTSVAHVSSQFKSITGLTTSHFKGLKRKIVKE